LDKAALEDRVGGPVDQLAQPLVAMNEDEGAEPAKQLEPPASVARPGRQLALDADELGPGRLALALKEVGVDQPRQVVAGLVANGLDEAGVHEESPSRRRS